MKKEESELKMVEMGGLCEELIEEVLDRLPIKQLMRMKCLSKYWCGLISRYRQSRPRASGSTILCHYLISGYKLEVMFVNAKEQRGTESLEHESRIFSRSSGIILKGSSNGLLLFCRIKFDPYELVIYVCNPFRNPWHWDTLPSILNEFTYMESTYFGMGLAFDGVPLHPYKVICYILDRETLFRTGCMEFYIYSSDTGEWRKCRSSILNFSSLLHDLGNCPTLFISTPQLFWKDRMVGVLNDCFMLLYHFDKDTLQVLKFPHRDVGLKRGLLWESEGCLHYCLIHKDGVLIWKYVDENLGSESFAVIEDKSICNGKWKLKHKVEITTEVMTSIIENSRIHDPMNSDVLTSFRPCAFDEGLQILYFQLPKTILSYSLETQKWKEVQIFESLITPRFYFVHLIYGVISHIGDDFKMWLSKPKDNL